MQKDFKMDFKNPPPIPVDQAPAADPPPPAGVGIPVSAVRPTGGMPIGAFKSQGFATVGKRNA